MGQSVTAFWILARGSKGRRPACLYSKNWTPEKQYCCSAMHEAHASSIDSAHTLRPFCPMTCQLSRRVLALQSQYWLPYNDRSWFPVASVKRVEAVILTSRLRMRLDDCDDELWEDDVAGGRNDSGGGSIGGCHDVDITPCCTVAT